MTTRSTPVWPGAQPTDARHPRLVSNHAEPPRDFLERIAVRRGGAFVFLPVDDIDWIEAADNYVRIHAGGARYLIRDTISGFADRLDPRRFVRIHRRTVVSIARVRQMQPLFHGEYLVTLADGTELRSGRTYCRVMRELLSNRP